MPRTKQFDESEALEKAMTLFWSRGFEATSMQALVDTMGINRGSLYDSFGDKRTLFEKALERYDQEYRKARFERLETTLPPRRALEVFLEEAIEESVNDDERRGCFIVNTMLELAPHDPEITRYVTRVIKEAEASLERIIRRGQQRGEVSPAKDATALARFLLHVAFGLRVMARVNPRRSEMDAAARFALSALD